MEKAGIKKNLALFLTGLVIFSAGFAIGRHTNIGMTCGENSCAKNSACAQCPATPATSSPAATAATSPVASADKLVVYYMHRTQRCYTCNLVESQAKELLEKEFAAQLKSGLLEWRSVDFLQDQSLAQKYEVGFNMIVLSKLIDGKEVHAEKLDQVMSLAREKPQFDNYVRTAINKWLTQKQ